MILKNVDVATTPGIDQISIKSLKDGAPVIAIYYKPVDKTILFRQNNRSAKRKPLFKKRIKSDTKNY